MRMSTTLVGTLLGCVIVAAPGSAADWRNAVNTWLQNSGLDRNQQRTVQNQLNRIAQQRKKAAQKGRKESQKKSLAAIKEAYEKGKKAFNEKRYSAAYLHFQDVAFSELRAAAKMSADAKSKVLEIEAMALGKVEQAKIHLLQNQQLLAAEALQEVVSEFPYCDAADQARSRLQGLRSIPSVAASMRYGEGRAQHDAEAFAEALRIYDEVVQRWPAEIAALRARVAAESIRNDPEKMALVHEARLLEADRVCPTLLNLARSFIMNYEHAKKADNPDPEMLDELRMQAAEKLNQVIRDFPGTSYAREAQTLLESIGAAR